MRRSTITFSAVLGFVLAFAISTDSLAAKGGGKPGGGNPPPACADAFPNFTYVRAGTRKQPEALMLASADACRSEVLIADTTEVRASSVHLTENGPAGVLVWTEEPGNNAQYVVRMLDFTVDSSGVLTIGEPVTILQHPDPQEGEQHYYFVPDVWGNEDHSELYLSVYEISRAGTPQETRKVMIYDLNDLSEAELYPSATGASWSWTCHDDTLYPQTVPGCSAPESARWNASGTRLYLSDQDVNGWTVTMRIDVQRGETFADWIFDAPELVYTGARSGGDYTEPGGAITQPDSFGLYVPSEIEHLTMSYLDRTGQQTVRQVILLNADSCVDYYAGYSGGDLAPPDGGWLSCDHTHLYTLGNNLWGGPWQSHEAFLRDYLSNRGSNSIYRYHAVGGMAGTSELLIEGAKWPDTGL